MLYGNFILQRVEEPRKETPILDHTKMNKLVARMEMMTTVRESNHSTLDFRRGEEGRAGKFEIVQRNVT